MSHEKWYSKGEVLNDLGQVSGQCRGDGLRHVTDRPPALATGDDEEMKELLKRVGRSSSIKTEGDGPDLAYIADLISQARQYDSHIPEYSEKPTIEIEHKALVISKPTGLNPNVPEFTPRMASNSLGSPSVIVSKKNRNMIKENCELPSDDGLEKSARDLKKFIVAQPADTVQSIHKRNVALLSLMSLYANQSPVPQQEEVSEQRLSHAVQDKNDTTQRNGNITIMAKAEVEENNTEVVEEVGEEATRQQIEESIKKVDQWLSGPTKEVPREVKPKTPFTAQLKPFTYKKKEKPSTGICDAPTNVVTSSSSQSSTQGSKKYVPSKYAQELYKEFEQQRDKQHLMESRDKTLWGYIEKGICDNKHSKK